MTAGRKSFLVLMLDQNTVANVDQSDRPICLVDTGHETMMKNVRLSVKN